MAAIALPARITMADATAALALLQPQLAATGAAVIDASALAELDTAALAVLLDCRRQALARGQPLQLQGAPAKLRQLAQLYGVAELLGLESTNSADSAVDSAADSPAAVQPGSV